MKSTLDVWTEGYLEYLYKVQKKGWRTIIDIRCTLKRVLGIVDAMYPGKALWQLSLAQLLRWLEHDRAEGRAVRSLAKDLSHVRGLLTYAWRSGRCDRNVLDGFNLQDDAPEPAKPQHLELAEVRALIEACPRKTSRDRQERLVVLLLYGCGFRNAELRALDVEDIDLQRQEIFVRFGKGERERRVPVPGGVWSELLVYLAERRARRGALFRTTQKHRRIAALHVCDIVRRAGIRAGIANPVFPKTLRHTFATHLIDRGVDIGVIASLMGHRSPQETGVYLHVLQGKKEDAVARLSMNRRSAP